MNLPNKLTVVRVALTGVFIALLSFENLLCFLAGYAVFIAASITDYYDGKIARERNLITNFGKLLDPVADKILITAAFVMIMLIDALHVPGWVVVVILGREFLVTGVRSLAASEGAVIGANNWGKSKTVIQLIYIYTFLGFATLRQAQERFVPGLVPWFDDVLRETSLWAAVFVAAVTVYSGVQFLHVNWKSLNLDHL